MLRKIGSIILLLLLASVAMAAEPTLPSIFEPVPEDLSMWYLANIFGPDLVPIPNAPNTQLLSSLFGIFNQILLGVGLIILVYFLLTSVLNTAAEGKALGEKWHSIWVPIRITLGLGMLIPKAGSGYCMAQFLVMWVIMQGIGAADTTWSALLDYFGKEGGTIYETDIGDQSETNYTYANMDYVYSQQATGPVGDANDPVSLLRSMVCMQKNNDSPDKFATYTMYSREERRNLLIFGNKEKYDYPKSDELASIQGAECGVIKFGTNTGENNNKKTSDKNEHQQYVDITYVLSMRRMYEHLKPVAKVIADDLTNTPWEDSFGYNRLGMVAYIENIVAESEKLLPPNNTEDDGERKSDLAMFKDYGWILAGNYYTLLSHLGTKEPNYAGKFILPSTKGIDGKWEYSPPRSSDTDNVANIDAYFKKFADNPKAMYDVAGSEWQLEQADELESYEAAAGTGTARTPLTKNKMQDIQKAVGASNSNELTGTTAKEVKNFMKYLSGKQGTSWVSQDPILAASKHGQHLTEAAMALMATFGTLWVGGMLLAAWGSCAKPHHLVLQTAMDIVAPLMVALGSFMYAEGAVLGVFIPVIPYLTFLTGVTGFFLCTVEGVVAAPIVALALILPEGKEDIWGRAGAAYMLLLNLCLRPSLMIIGFGAAMIVTWVTVEILNIGFLTLVSGTFRIENMFGFVTIMMAYTAVFTYIVTEAYSLINVVPNRAMTWIGHQGEGVKGPEEAIGAAKQGAEAGGRATAAGAASIQQRPDMYRATAHTKQASDADKAKDKETTSNQNQSTDKKE